MNEAMGDIETLGREPGCVILSIGAAMFDPRGDGHGDTFYRNVDLTSSLLEGFTFDESTLDWWQKQNTQAVGALGAEAVSIQDALFDFVDWYNKNKAKKFWCQGLTFDVPILEAAMKKFDIRIPWQFWAVRDTRSAYDICGFNDKSLKRDGTYHNALDDSTHQILCLQTAYKNGR